MMPHTSFPFPPPLIPAPALWGLAPPSPSLLPAAQSLSQLKKGGGGE